MDYGIGTLVGTGMGLLLEGHNDKRQIDQQRRLQDLQIKGQQQMGDYNYGKQLQFWKDTNFQAQMEQLKMAGLNPALMYKQGGTGGMTIGAPGSGGVQGGGAPTGGMEVMNMIGQKAQIELMKAQTEKTKAEAQAVAPGIEKTKAETNLVTQNIKNAQSQEQYTKAMTAWQQLETQFATQSYHTRQNQIEQQLEQTIQTIRQIGLQNDFTRETWQSAVKQLEANVLQTQVHSDLLEAQKRATNKGIELSTAQITKIAADIAQGWQKLTLEQIQGQRESVKLAQTDLDLLLKQIQTEFNITHPGLWNTIGGTLEQTIKETVEDIKNRIKRTIPKL